MDDSEEVQPEKVYYLFGQDIRTIPCFRTTTLMGCACSISAMLLTFLFTSNGIRATNAGFGALAVSTIPYWMYCIKEHFDNIDQLDQIKVLIENRTEEDYVFLDSLESAESESWG